MKWNNVCIKELRQRLGWSVAEMARRLSVTSETLRYWEAGTKNVSEESFSQLDHLEIQLEKYNEDTFSSPRSENYMDTVGLDQVIHSELE